jgi:PilZ domain
MGGTAPKSMPAHHMRRFPRYQLDARISISVFRDGTSVSLWGRSTEFGEDGIGGTLTEELQPGEVVSLELALPLTPYPLRLRALVRYRDGLRHGFEFLTRSPEQRTTIQRVCEMLAAGE